MNSGGVDGTGAREPEKRRWLWPLLIVSLGLNLLFVGLFAGQWWVRGHKSRAPHHVVTQAVEKLVKELPAAKRERAQGLVKQHRETVRSIRQEFRGARDAAKDAVVAEPYDDAKLAGALARLRELRTGQHESMHVMVRELLKDLTLDERKKLLSYVRAGFKRGRGRKGRSPEKDRGAPATRQ